VAGIKNPELSCLTYLAHPILLRAAFL